MNNRISVILVALFILFSVGCKSRKSITQPDPAPAVTKADAPRAEEAVLRMIDANKNTFSYYQARINANYKDDKQKLELDINLMMEKDKYIWMSITALLGIEVARVMITPDSVKVLDRLHRKYIATDFSYIQRMSNVPLRLEQLQNLIIGNTVFPNNVQKSVTDSILGKLMVSTPLNTQRQITVYTSNYRAERTEIKEQNQSREMRVHYNSFSTYSPNLYPNNININIRAEKNVECSFALSNFVFEKKREPQFAVPSGYEVVKP